MVSELEAAATHLLAVLNSAGGVEERASGRTFCELSFPHETPEKRSSFRSLRFVDTPALPAVFFNRP